MSFFGDLKRRNVLRVGATYAAVAWLLIQIAETTFPAFGLSPTWLRAVIVILCVGFLPTLVIAWAFELTPAGLKRDYEVDRDAPSNQRLTRRLDRLLILALTLALGYFGLDKFVLAPRRLTEELATATELGRQAARDEAAAKQRGALSIAVMPFADLSPAGNQRYFSDGISEELLNLLARVSELRVISRSSSFALRDLDLAAPEIARRLNVDYLLQGSVRRRGATVRITVQLIDGRSDSHVWSGTYSRSLDDIFAVQDQISSMVVSELKVRLLGRAPAVQPTAPSAYDLYLRGRSLLSGTQDDGPQRSVALFEQVIRTVPDYAPAHASLALARIATLGGRSAAQESLVETSAKRALALDPDNSDALAALGRIQWFRRRVDEARQTLKRAISANPSNPLAYRWLGSTYINRDPVRYQELVENAYRLIDPLYPGIHYILATSLNRLGRREEALDVARRWLESEPDATFAYLLAEWVHFTNGRQDLGLESAYCAFRADPDNESLGAIAWRLLDMGEFDLAGDWIQQRQSTGRSLAEQRALLAFERRRPEQAASILATARQAAELPDADFAFWTLRLNRDFDLAREAYERAFSEIGRNPLDFDPDINWLWYLDYALILRHDGLRDQARLLLEPIETLIEKQIKDGVVLGSFLHLQLHLAELHAIRNEPQLALAALGRAIEQGFTTAGYLRAAPQFDTLRQDPRFQALYRDVESELAAQRRRLVDTGRLLAPEALRALDDFYVDPFVERSDEQPNGQRPRRCR